MIIITDHAKKRMRERLKIPKRAVARAAWRAYVEGDQPEDYAGLMRNYLDDAADQNDCEVRVFQNNIYVFGKAEDDFSGETNAVLVTVHALDSPLKLRPTKLPTKHSRK